MIIILSMRIPVEFLEAGDECVAATVALHSGAHPPRFLVVSDFIFTGCAHHCVGCTLSAHAWILDLLTKTDNNTTVTLI